MHPRVGDRRRPWCLPATVGAVLLVVGPLTACSGSHPSTSSGTSNASVPQRGSNGQAAYLRTELFFGKSIPGGGTVTETAFVQFLDEEVTPRSPAGFTVVPAMGQYREANGVIDHETSDMLILFYPESSVSDASKKIDEIRAAYNKTFHQESVLREEEQPSCVSF
jgi:hypothetical protein